MKLLTVNEVLTRVSTAVGVGDGSVADPFSSNEKLFIQMRGLLQDAGDELVKLYDWEVLQKEESFTTSGLTSYDYPDDFDRMISGTHWNATENNPLAGGISPQEWQYVQNSGVVGSTIYASFRRKEGKMYVWPVDTGTDIVYEYISNNWLQHADLSYGSEITAGTDTILYDAALIRNYLQAKFYKAKGFDTVSPEKVASMFFNAAMSTDNSPPILSVGRTRTSFPLIGYHNLPDTGYGA